MVGEGALRVHLAEHDLAHRVGDDDVDPLVRRDDGLVRGGEGRGVGREAHIGALPGAGLVHRAAKDPERAMRARRDGSPGGVRRLEAAARLLSRSPRLDRDRALGQAVRELATRRDLDQQQLDAGVDQHPRLVDRVHDRGLLERRPDPRPPRIAEQREQLASREAVRIDPVEPHPPEAPRLGLGDCPALGPSEQLGLDREVDVARCDLERELVRLEVVLGRGHRERQRDPARQPRPVRRHVAVDDLGGQRPAGTIDAGDAEHPQDRALLADRRGPGGGCSERCRERVGVFGECREAFETGLGAHVSSMATGDPAWMGRSSGRRGQRVRLDRVIPGCISVVATMWRRLSSAKM